MKQQPSKQDLDVGIQDILVAINSFSDRMDNRFCGVESRMDSLEGRVSNIEDTMATKTYTDYKLADLKGDLVTMNNRIVEKLEEKNIFTSQDVRYVKA